jgi:hypothetical protein
LEAVLDVVVACFYEQKFSTVYVSVIFQNIQCKKITYRLFNAFFNCLFPLALAFSISLSSFSRIEYSILFLVPTNLADSWLISYIG